MQASAGQMSVDISNMQERAGSGVIMNIYIILNVHMLSVVGGCADISAVPAVPFTLHQL